MVSTNLKRLRGKRRFLKANVDMKVLSNTIAYFLAIYADSKIFSNMEGGGGGTLKGKGPRDERPEKSKILLSAFDICSD